MKPIKQLFRGSVLVATLLVGCGKPGYPPADPTNVAPKKFYMVQTMKGHPVHQMTQIAFAEGCRKLGYQFEIIGTDNNDVNATLSLAEQALAKGDAAGMLAWASDLSWRPFLEKVGRTGLPIVVPHFPAAENSIPGVTGIISGDQKDYARAAALEIGRCIKGQGTVAVTQGSFNSVENLVVEIFTATMRETYPAVKVLAPQEEGFDAPKAIARAGAILQSDPTVVAALSSTGSGPTTWAGAQRETNRKIVIVGMDYTRINLDLVKDGLVHAIVAQPLWEESYGAVELLDKKVRGEKIPWWTRLPAPLVTKDQLDSYYLLLDNVERALRR